MRTSVYAFLLITCLLLTPYAVYAGTDDSGLQVFTIDFSKQLGESADVAQEDTLFSPYCYNMFSSGNGMTTLSEPEGYGTEWSGPATDIATIDAFGYNFIRTFPATGTSVYSSEVYLHYNPTYSAPTSGRSLLIKDVLNRGNSEMVAVTTMDKGYLFVGSKFLRVTGSVGSPTTVEVALPSIGQTMAVWNNRVFFAYGYTIFYSAPQNFEDFSNTATTGGTTNIYECDVIIKLIGTKYGLYIFTDSGIFLQSGTGSKNSWNIEKISNLILSNRANATIYNDIIYFSTYSYDGNKVYVISGATVQEFLKTSPDTMTSISGLQICDAGNFLCFFNSTVGGTTWLYNVASKSFARNSEFNYGGSNRYYLKRTSTGYKVYEFPHLIRINNTYSYPIGDYLNPMTPWAYQTNWMTLDGNASARKEIDRVEFDYQGGTVAVGLYYAYGNGSSSGSAITLVAPVNTRLSTYTWNAPIGKQQSNRFYLYFLSSGTQTMTTNYILKQARIYYRNIGNYKTNSLR